MGGGGCPDRAIWEVTLEPRVMGGHEETWGLEAFVFGALKGLGMWEMGALPGSLHPTLGGPTTGPGFFVFYGTVQASEIGFSGWPVGLMGQGRLLDPNLELGPSVALSPLPTPCSPLSLLACASQHGGPRDGPSLDSGLSRL